MRRNSASTARMARCAGASARRPPPSTRAAAWCGFRGVTIDITERKRAEERQNLLAREVDHRAKNALALAQSIVRLTRANEVKDYVQAVEGRISALARVHTILSLSNWEGAEVGRLIEEEIAPYSTGEQIAFHGAELRLQPATAQTLALALHELVTNSAKYGALSALSGRLNIRWEARPDALQLVWEEHGGPPVETADLARLRHAQRDREHRESSSAARPNSTGEAKG